MDHALLQQVMRARVFPITRGIAQGPFASPARADPLRAAGVTHLLNVGEAPSVLQAGAAAFREVVWHSLVDLAPIPPDVAQTCLDTLHSMLLEPGSRVYVHCVAGWNRSPTVVWLYLVACGLDPALAREAIARRSWDAVPAHPKLVTGDLVQFVQGHGRSAYLPHARPDVLEWAEELA
jgi:hypothetical protein